MMFVGISYPSDLNLQNGVCKLNYMKIASVNVSYLCTAILKLITEIRIKEFMCQPRGQKFHLSAHNYEWNLERTSNFSQQVFCKELLEESILHITPLSYLLHTLLKDNCMCLQEE